MLKQQYLPWENYPKKLNHTQIVKPLTVLADFFSVDWPDGHEEKLEAWRYFVKHDRSYEDSYNGPGSLLFIYDLNIKLLEAAYLLCYSVGEKDGNRKLNHNFSIKDEKMIVANLSDKEIADPYLALKAIFKKTGLKQYREYLHQWLYAALYIKGGADELTRKEIKTVFRSLLKLYSAAWLIYQREVENKSI